MLPHPPRSSDLVPNDYFLSLNFKKWLCGVRFNSHNDHKDQTKAYVSNLHKYFHPKGVNPLEKHWIKCIELQGD